MATAGLSCYGGVTNVGLTDRYEPDINYQDVFRGFMERLGFDEDLSLAERRLYSHVCRAA